jgi:chaperonin GroES
MALKLLGYRVMIKIDEARTSEGGILLPESAQERPQKGCVVAVGEGKRLDNGTLVAPDVVVGDHVIFAKYGGTEIKDEGEDYTILDADSIYAKDVAPCCCCGSEEKAEQKPAAAPAKKAAKPAAKAKKK